jgi:hypothetical protein
MKNPCNGLKLLGAPEKRIHDRPGNLSQGTKLNGYLGAADRCGSLWLRTDVVGVAGMSLKGLLFLDNRR